MPRPKILHLFSPTENVSPFDVNMAADAGYEIIVPYREVSEEATTALVQDAIFSRPPKSFAATGVFIGGHDVNQAAAMLERARKALVPPFEVSLFADPNGAYTTAAALVALVGKHLGGLDNASFAGVRVAVFGGGPVGLCAAVLVAQHGGEVSLVRLTQSAKQGPVERFAARYGVVLPSIDGQSDALKADALRSAHVAITTAKAGIQVLHKALLDAAPELRVAADVNAVPPTGIEGVEPLHGGTELRTRSGSIKSLGALAIGKLKYDVQHGLFKQMLQSDHPQCLDFPDAYALAASMV